MSFKQCSGCAATVDVSKAYCPECGAPMDEEQKRTGASEYDSLMKTQQISRTTQFKLSEYFNQSPNLAQPKDTGQSNEAGNERKSVVFNLQSIAPPANVTSQKPENVAPQTGNESNRIADRKASVEDASKSQKKAQVVFVGIILLFLFLALIVVIILGILYWRLK
ncbi:MAG: hypothetical protein LH472_02065 [Pyrinomonadaceae bacterium]|nr:hypothetical protein [Pyrinomonadaceae bacterium]